MNFAVELNRAHILSAAVIDNPEHAVPLARALLAGGLSIMEVTFRNAHAPECIRRIRNEVPAMTVGAGTLMSAAQVDETHAAGAQFGVSPGLSEAVSQAARWSNHSNWVARSSSYSLRRQAVARTSSDRLPRLTRTPACG